STCTSARAKLETLPAHAADCGLSGRRPSVDEKKAPHELAVCLQKKKTSGKPTNDCGSVVCGDEVGQKPSSRRLLPTSRHVGIDQRLWMYGPNQSPVDTGKKSVSWKLSGADSGRITDHPQRKYSIENSERALKCSAGFPEVDGKGAGDHARKSKKTAFF